MKSIYLLTYDALQPPRDAFIAWLDRQPKMLDWQATSIAQLYVLVWDGSVEELRDVLHAEAGLRNFICVAISPRDLGSKLTGWMSAATVDFIRGAAAERRELASSAK